jgi:hypothetical protein
MGRHAIPATDHLLGPIMLALILMLALVTSLASMS